MFFHFSSTVVQTQYKPPISFISKSRPHGRTPQPQFVHVDQTPVSAVAKIYKYTSPAELPDLLNNRFQIINLWRPFASGPVRRPLALCDFRSLEVETDVIPYTSDWIGETSLLKFSDSHRWGYFHSMCQDEVILIKWYYVVTPFRPYF